MAGHSFWAWADYEEYSRPPLAARDGWTIEGLLDAQARPRPELQILSMTCFEMDHPELVWAPEIEVLAEAPSRNETWKVVPLDGIATKQGALERIVAQGRSRFVFANPSFDRLLVDGIEFVCRDDSGQSPLLLGSDNELIEIPVNQTVSAIAILGNVALRGGYPYNTTSSVYHADREVEAPYASLASRYELIYEDGEEAIEIKHGIDMLRGNDICRWWKTAPRSPETRPAVRTVLHPSLEVLRYDLWEHALARPRKLKSVRWTLADAASIQALLALSVKISH
jgi:hypothetical protein